MQVSVEDINSVKKVLHIEIPVETITKELDKAYNSLKKTAKVKGFRPGKAPRSVLERLYQKDVLSDVSSSLIQDSFFKALKEKELEPIGNPEIDPPELTSDAPYAYDATVEIKPELGTIDFKGIDLKKSLYKVTDEMVDGQLKMLQSNLAQKVAPKDNRPSADGDFLVIDYEGFKDGEAFEPVGKTENYTLKLGDATILEAFDKELEGVNTGDEKEFSVTFPEDYHNKELAGQEVSFKVTVKDILVEELPEIDDEFAKKMGPFETLDDLKAAIQKNYTEGYDKRSEQELNEQAFTDLIGKIDFEVPEALVKFELDNIVADAERQFAQNNMTFEDVGISRESLTEKYRDTAEKQARRYLILSGIIEQESLTLTDEELDEGLKEMAAAYQQPFENFKQYFMTQKDKLGYFKETLLEKKAMKLVLEHANISEVEADAASEEADAE